MQTVYKEPASWSNAGQRGEYLESTFIRPKDWPTTGKRRQYYTPSGKGIDDPWFFESGTQESFDQMWNKYEEYRRKMKDPQNKLPKLQRPDQVESKDPGGLLEQTKIGVDVPQARSAIEPQIGAIKSIGYKEPKKAPGAFGQFAGHAKNLFDKDATEESKSESLGAISPHLKAIGGLGKSLFGAVFDNKTGNEGKFQEALAIKEKNKVALNPVMNFNNGASSLDDVASAANPGTKLGPWGRPPTTNNNAPAFIKGGYLKLFKK